MKLAILMAIGSPWSRDVAERLAALGHTVWAIDVCSRAAPGQYLSARDSFQQTEIEGLRRRIAGVHALDGAATGRFRYFLRARQLRRLLGRLGAEVLLVLYGGGFASLAWLSGFRPFAVFVVGSDVLMCRSLKRVLTRAAYGRAACVLANGEYLADRTRELCPSAHVETLLLGIDLRRFGLTPRTARPVRILCNRGFLPVYNNAAIIQAVASLVSLPDDWCMVFASAGPGLTEARELARRILPGQSQSRVEFLGGVERERMDELLRTSHVFVSMAHSDGTATSLLEALACGLFPVLSDLPQNREWVDPVRQNGLLVPLDDVGALALALRRAVSEPALRAGCVDFNRAQVVQRADAAASAVALADRLQSARGGNDRGLR